ncbi:hypothetical protein E2K80_14035 [Rhodophyticola sp. CCM32]|uniref:hypothetical protein n=1 Tax=Rhodophyticola sp. CCM32 TaxID=2916397 RepID=UPI00107F34DE|nr:hypothetical protein [Rhodophyticola sp. CCM32]QBY01708.1 hypothetical protein E2K80_14035 [Rhodophyticola sp. CCM32]
MSTPMQTHTPLTPSSPLDPGKEVTARFTLATPLHRITLIRSLFGAVQIVSKTGDKHLLKYQADPAGVITRMDAARQEEAR